jgi:hypothetical protein
MKKHESPSPTSRGMKICKVRHKKLHRHPDYDLMCGAIHARSPDVLRAIEKCRANELTRPPVVARVPGVSGYIIITGVADVFAAKVLGTTAVLVQIVNCTSLAHALAQMIELDQARPKTPLDVAMEVYYCYRAQKRLAKERQRDGGGDRRSTTATKHGPKESLPPESAGSDRGETRDIVARITHESRDRVLLMIGLVKKALKMNPKAPRDTRLGKALAHPDCDLKAIALEYGVLKPPSAKSTTARTTSTATAARSAKRRTAESTTSTTTSTRTAPMNREDALVVLLACIEQAQTIIERTRAMPLIKIEDFNALHSHVPSMLRTLARTFINNAYPADKAKVKTPPISKCRRLFLRRVERESAANGLRADVVKKLGFEDSAHLERWRQGKVPQTPAKTFDTMGAMARAKARSIKRLASKE